MAAAVTLLSMRTAVRQRASMEFSQFCTDAEINGYLNEGLTDLYDKFVQAGGQNYFRSTNTFNTSANIQLYALPADFYQLVSVDINIAPGGSWPTFSARKYQEEERNLYSLIPGWVFGSPVGYMELGSNISFIPVPTGSYSVTLNYVRTMTLLAADPDVFDGLNGMESYAVWYATAMCLAKEESDPSFANMQCAKLETRILNMIQNRHASADRIKDVTLESQGYGNGCDW